MTQEMAEFLVSMVDGDVLDVEVISGFRHPLTNQPEHAVSFSCSESDFLKSVIAGIFSTPNFSTDDYPTLYWEQFEAIKTIPNGTHYNLSY